LLGDTEKQAYIFLYIKKKVDFEHLNNYLNRRNLLSGFISYLNLIGIIT